MCIQHYFRLALVITVNFIAVLPNHIRPPIFIEENRLGAFSAVPPVRSSQRLCWDIGKNAFVNHLVPEVADLKIKKRSLQQISCNVEGYFVNPESNCQRYYQCVKRDGKFHTFEFECNREYMLELKSSTCVYWKCLSQEMLDNCIGRIPGFEHASFFTEQEQLRTKREVGDVNNSNECSTNGTIFGDATDCKVYYKCNQVNGVFRVDQIACQFPFLFDETNETSEACVNPTSMSAKSKCILEAQKYIDALQSGNTHTEEIPVKGSDIETTFNPHILSSVAPQSDEQENHEDEDTADDVYNSKENELNSTEDTVTEIKTRATTTEFSLYPATATEQISLNPKLTSSTSSEFQSPGTSTDSEFLSQESAETNESMITPTGNNDSTSGYDSSNKSGLEFDIDSSGLSNPDTNFSSPSNGESTKSSTETIIEKSGRQILSLFSSNYEIAIAICALLLILIFVIFFFCCYLLKSIYKWVTLQKLSNPKLSKVCFKKVSRNPARSFKASTANTFQDLDDDKNQVELKSITVIQSQSNELATICPRRMNQFSTFELQAAKNIEFQTRAENQSISQAELALLGNEKELTESDVNVNQQLHNPVENKNIRKKVEIYIPHLNLHNVRDPLYIRSIVEEMEDEYFNIMESKDLHVEESRISLVSLTSRNDDIPKQHESTGEIDDVVSPSLRNSCTFLNGRIAHVSPFNFNKTNSEAEIATFKTKQKVSERDSDISLDPLTQPKVLEYYF